MTGGAGHGTDIGTIDDIDFDPASGAVISLHTSNGAGWPRKAQQALTDRLHGLAAEASFWSHPA